MAQRTVIIIGPAHPLRGGLASFNERLARAFMHIGYDVTICTFTLQYPEFLFPGTTQYSEEPAPADLKILPMINSVNPLNWLLTGKKLRHLRADLIVVRYWLPFMGPALGTILRQVKKNSHTRIVCIADNVIPHEKRIGDKAFTRYFLKPVDAFITMSNKVLSDLRQFTTKPAQCVSHPLYDNFGIPVSMAEARSHLHLPADKRILLFFGFIRKYKGLDWLLEAMHILKLHAEKHPDFEMPILVIAGEYYEDPKPYETLLNTLRLHDSVILHTQFITDSEVKYFLCAADAVVQPYKNATQSGVTPLAYHFEIPMIVTRVGGLPDMVPDEKTGLIAEPTPSSIAECIIRFYRMNRERMVQGLQEEKKKYSWQNLIDAIHQLK
ncbi:MAG: glycosyltransferase family 4 protein [Ferruginibacter sp.]|nr:glycosyltransferase family 4 protein [Ferruginibacter sp.]